MANPYAADWEKVFPGQRQTRLKYQVLGTNNRVYPWVITQNAEGATVKMTEEQMRSVVNAYLDAKGYDLLGN